MRKENAYIYFLIGCFVVILILPATNGVFNYFQPKKLEGAYVIMKKPIISFDSWINNEFQPKYEAWLKENIGFRGTLIRLYNQFEYSILNEPNAVGVFIGKNNVLYDVGYYNAYIGSDYVGEEKIIDDSKKTLLIQNKLEEKNIPFLFVMAPGKVSIYPEFLPKHKQKSIPGLTNDKMYAKHFKKNDINFINFNEVFKQMKDTAPYPLFPKGGIHWSGYSVAYVADTISKRLDKLSDYILPEIEISRGRTTNKDMVFTDNDLGKLMNLSFPTKNWAMHYPNINFKSRSKRKPKVLIIGDSFAQSFFGFGPYYSSLFSNDSQYWQNYKFGYWKSDTNQLFYEINKINLVDIVESFDMAMIISTETNMNNPGMGFIDDLYESYMYLSNLDLSNAKTLGYFDFEDYINLKETILSLSQQSSYSGSYANCVTPEKIYSRGFHIHQNELDLVDNQINLAISLNYLIDTISEILENEIKLVVEINSVEKLTTIKYETWRFRVRTVEPDQWRNKTVRYKVPRPQEEFSIKIYVFNTGKIPILIDNFEVLEVKF